MVSPVAFNGSPRVYFTSKDDLINKPGKFSTQPAEAEGDKVDISSEAKEASEKSGKKGVLKTIGAVIGGIGVLAAASFGLFKWKGSKWIVPEAKGVAANLKKWLVKPGEFIDTNIIKPIGNFFSRKPNASESVEEILEEVIE